MPGYLQEMLSTEPSLVTELVQLFLRDSAEGLDRLEQRVAEGDAEATAKVVHTLKGSSNQIGGLTLGAELEALEGRLRDRGVASIRESLPGLLSLFDALREEMEVSIADPGRIPASEVVSVPLPGNEEQRLEALARYDIFDTAEEESFDRITRLAASLFSVPIALISIVDRDRIRFKSRVGLSERETSREHSFSAWTILSKEVLIVCDARAEARFRNADVQNWARGPQFYAGAPLITPDGFAIGALAIIDREPRSTFTAAQAKHLQDLAGLIVDQLELRRTTLQLRASEADYQDLFENCPVGIYRSTPSGEILMANPAILRMLDYPSMEELKAINLETGELMAQRQEWKRRLEAKGKLPDHENTWYMRDGTALQVCESTRVVRRADGTVAYYEGWAEDISIQKAAETERERAQLFNHKLIEAVPDLIYIFDFEKERSVFTNRSYFKVVGHDPEYVRALANPIEDLVHPDDLVPLRKHRERLKTAPDGEFLHLEFRTLDGDGKYRLLSCRETVFSRDEYGAAKELLGVIRDISEGKAIEERLRSDEQRWQLVLAANNDGLWDWDARTGQIFHSPRWREMLGYGEDETQSMPVWEELLHPEDVARVQQRLFAYLHREAPFYQEEYRLRTRDGSYRWVFARGVAQWDADGNLLRMVGSHTDITERKEAELALRLQAVDLAEARDKAESAVVAKSDFLATMSHEIRTPLNGVLGMTAMLAETELSAEQQDYLRTIRSSGSALLSVINDILDFSKIEAGYMEIEEADFDLTAVIEESLDLLAGEADRKGVELAAKLDDGVPVWVRGDSARLRQVMLNLLSNAVKFTQRGEVVLSVSRVERPEGTSLLHFSVADTGIGLSAEAHDRLFTAFSQADASTTRRFGGTGLGLAISKRLVELMGGRIGAVSREGFGSTFWFDVHLPAAKRAALAKTERLDGRRVMIADDNATNRQIIQHVLESSGVEVVCVADGLEALSALLDSDLNGAPIDLALLDFHMPRMDGMMLTRAIRAQRSFRRLPIVLLTSVTQRDHAEAARDLNIQGYLVKPIRNSELIRTIRSILPGGQIEHTALRKPSAAVSVAAPMRGTRVLLVEDNPVNQKVGALMLARLGYEADLAENGLKAVEAFQKFRYPAILLDCQMPEMDGFDATRAIRKIEGGERRTSIVALTANAMEGERERCLAAGMDDYLSKPISMKALSEKLASVLDASPPTREEGDLPAAPRSS
jgi:PAS domain S-box-containing protein